MTHEFENGWSLQIRECAQQAGIFLLLLWATDRPHNEALLLEEGTRRWWWPEEMVAPLKAAVEALPHPDSGDRGPNPARGRVTMPDKPTGGAALKRAYGLGVRKGYDSPRDLVRAMKAGRNTIGAPTWMRRSAERMLRRQ
jgi:hypothetical protein